MHVALEPGLALVRFETTLASRARFPAEIRYRLALPNGDITPIGLQICASRDDSTPRCSEGARLAETFYDRAIRTSPPRPDRNAGPEHELRTPIASAVIRDGHAVLSGAPIVRGEHLRLRYTYAVRLEAEAGHQAFVLPARGHDLRIRPALVSVSSEDLTQVRVGESSIATQASGTPLDPWRSFSISADLSPRSTRTLLSFPCSAGRCVFDRQASPAAFEMPEELHVLVDRSPSVVGKEGAQVAALRALIAALPSETRIRLRAFASEVAEVGDASAGEVPSRWIDQATEYSHRSRSESSLGARTRLGQAIANLRGDILVIGDGDVADALPAHVDGRLFVLNIADSSLPSESDALLRLSEQSRGRYLAIGSQATDAAFAGHQDLTRSVRSLFSAPAPQGFHGEVQIALRPRRRGERARRASADAAQLFLAMYRHQEAPMPLVAFGEDELRALARETPPPAISHRCFAPAPFHATGRSPHIDPIAHAGEAICAQTTMPILPNEVPRSLPRETVLGYLRTHVVPQARRCLREDRRGRADYAVNVTYRFTIANREVGQVQVDGEIQEALRTCLERTLDHLEAPEFDGSIQVSYPIHTLRVEEESPTMIIDDETIRTLEEIAPSVSESEAEGLLE